ncbi:hypothetical protein Ancab_032471, partial [Ancistrocladus abbreviatus]
VKKQAKRNKDIKINAQNIGFNGRAKAYRGLKISKSLNQAASWLLRRGADGFVEQPIEHISAHA